MKCLCIFKLNDTANTKQHGKYGVEFSVYKDVMQTVENIISWQIDFSDRAICLKKPASGKEGDVCCKNKEYRHASQYVQIVYSILFRYRFYFFQRLAFGG